MKQYYREYSSAAALRIVSSQAKDAIGTESKTIKAMQNWDLGLGFNGALELARTGWREGAEQITKFDGVKYTEGRKQKESIVYDVVGDCWDMGKVMSGEPEAAMTWEQVKDTARGSRIVTMAVNIGALCHIEAETMFERGKKIVALIDAIEQSGKQVELCVYHNSQGDRKAVLLTVIKIKAAGEPLDLAKIAFWVAHPAALRRILFSLWEHDTKEYQLAHEIDSRYGRSQPTTEQEELQAEINITTDTYNSKNMVDKANEILKEYCGK